jgi:glycosyltransferase involved in cell wall biosynthesis
MFPGMTSVLRARLGAKCVLVLQDHSGVVPKLPIFQRSRHQQAWAASFRAADACTFTARELASRWHPVGLPTDGRVLEIPEASTTFRPIERAEARRRTGLSGEPAILWVGRVDTNKDPSMVLAAFAQSSGSLPGARLWMIVPSARDRAALEPLTAAAAPADRARIHVIGPRAYDEMPHYYSSADMLISASHHEGSGYAVIEAMACGATPCVTDIPPFRALTGNIGMLWPVGDVAACRQALERAAALVSARQRQSVRNHFDEQLSWRMIGRRTYDAYASLRR